MKLHASLRYPVCDQRQETMTEREQELSNEGWNRRTVADEPRLSELVETYQSLGYEVLIEPVPTREGLRNGECDGCSICFDNELRGRYKVLYTRKKDGAPVFDSDDVDELWT